MTFPWLHINRQSTKTRLVIPGWSILPHYFSTLISSDNLVVLNPFIQSQQQVKAYCDEVFQNEDIKVTNQPVHQILENGIDQVFIFSMGLQWVQEHAPELYSFQCDIVSPAIKYNQQVLSHMIETLKKSPSVTLKAFYRQCLKSKEDWAWWKQHTLDIQIKYNHPQTLMAWLEGYGRNEVMIPDIETITIWLDPNDTIGIKPIGESQNLRRIHHSSGHILRSTPTKTELF